jgi:carbon-monoxide dehydrogenase medium subunit
MYAFTFERPTTLKDAVSLLSKNEEAKLLAGGHSLIPVMKLRLASPNVLIDLSRIPELNGVKVSGDSVTIGATTTHSAVANSKELLAAMPALAAVPASIGDPHVRQAGTIGGSVANNDPNADYPAACLGLGATILTSKRKITADDFFEGMFSTALEPDEIITAISFPITKTAAYQKFKHPASGFALVGVFVSKGAGGVRVAVTGAGANGVFRVKQFEEALAKDFSPKAIESIKLPTDGMNSDIHAGAEYRAHIVGVMARRAVAAAMKG